MIVRSRSQKPEEFDDSKCRKYFSDLQKMFDLSCQDRMFRVDLSYYLLQKSYDNMLKKELVRGEGTIYKETMIAVVDLVDKVLNGKNICLLGLIQSSKTAVQVLGAVIACAVMLLKTGKICIPIFVTPNGKSYIGQFESKLERILLCFGEAKIIYKTRSRSSPSSISVKECLLKTQTTIKWELNEYLENDEMMSMKQKILLREQIKKFGISETNCTVLPVSPKYVSLFNILFSCVIKNDFNLLFMRDECHAAAAKDSVNDRIFKDDIIGYGKPFYEALAERDHVQCVMTSATNWQTLHLEPVPIPVNENYCGLDFCYPHGNQWHRIANGINKLPVLKDLDEMAVLIGNRDLAFARPSVYTDHELFYDDDDLVSRFRTHEAYKEAIGIALADLFMWIKENKPKPCNFTDKKFGNCIVFRFAKANEMMDEVLDTIKLHLDANVKIVKAYGEFGKYERVEDLLKQRKIEESDFCIFCATAKARMSDSFPARFAYGVDLTWDSSTLSALKQGIYGRVCGFFKDPFVVMSVKNAEVIREHINNNYRPDKSKKKLHNDSTSPRERTAIQFRFKELDTIPAFREIEEELNQIKVASIPMRGQQHQDLYTREYGRQDDAEVARQIFNIIFSRVEFIKENLRHFSRNITSEITLMEPGQEYSSEDGIRRFIYKDEINLIPRVVTRTEYNRPNNGGKEGDKIVIRVKAVKGFRNVNRIRIVGFDWPIVSKKAILWKENVGKNVDVAAMLKKGKQDGLR